MKLNVKKFFSFFKEVFEFIKFIFKNNFKSKNRKKKKELQEHFTKEGYQELKDSLDNHLSEESDKKEDSKEEQINEEEHLEVNEKLIEIALEEMRKGVKELPGSANSKEILKYAEDLGIKEYKSDSIPWCSLFMSWVVNKAGIKNIKTLLSRDWLKYGEKVSIPKRGDIVILKRGASNWEGHVGIFLRYTTDGKYVTILGGNQSDKVTISNYPAIRVLGFRRLKYT